MSKHGELAKESLGTFESAIMGIAGTAPAFSVAVTTATIVASVGVLSVGSIFYCGLIMFGIMLAFFHLSKITPHAGAAYAWVGHVFGPTWGFFTGWGLLVASIFFMVSATIPAATSTLVLLAPDFVENTVWVTGTAAIWLTLVTIVVTKGIKHASYTQLILTGIETAVVFALIIGAFIQYGGKPAHPPSIIWFSPFSFTPQLFATGALTAIFFYWGWDVTMNLSEETKTSVSGKPHPASLGAFWAMLNLILFFIIMMIVVLIVLSDEEIAQANTNVLYAIANKLFPTPGTIWLSCRPSSARWAPSKHKFCSSAAACLPWLAMTCFTRAMRGFMPSGRRHGWQLSSSGSSAYSCSSVRRTCPPSKKYSRARYWRSASRSAST